MKTKKYQPSTVEIIYFNNDVIRTSNVLENGTEVPDDWGLTFIG